MIMAVFKPKVKETIEDKHFGQKITLKNSNYVNQRTRNQRRSTS